MNQSQCDEIFARLQARNPHPTTELEYRSAFECLVAVMLSAQATDVGVNKATNRLFAQANTPLRLLALGEAGIKEHIKSLGLFNTKAKNLLNLCRQLLSDHNGEVPESRAALEALPGVGRKTANVVLNTVFGHAVIAVDTHIFRVANRTGLAKGAHVRAVEDQLTRTIAKKYQQNAHHWLILHGRYICTARKPKCGQCPISDLCEYPQKTHDIDQ